MDDEMENQENQENQGNQEEQNEQNDQDNGNSGYSGFNPGYKAADKLNDIAKDANNAGQKLGDTANKFRDKAAQKANFAKNNSGTKAGQKALQKSQKLEKKAEKLQKTAKKAQKLAQKAEKFAKIAAKLGKIIAMIGFAILIAMAIIGFLVFIITGWGMILKSLKAIAQKFFYACTKIIKGGENYVADEDIINVMDTIEQMGYDLYGYGFVTTQVGAELEAHEESTKDNYNSKDYSGKYIYYDTKDKKLIDTLRDVNAYRNLNAYLVSDNYAYYLKNNNFNFKSMAEGGFSGLFDNTKWGSGLISLYIQDGGVNEITGKRGEAYGFDLGDAASLAVAACMGPAGWLNAGIQVVENWDEATSSIKVNREKKTLEVSAIGLFSNQTFSYNLTGWTGRYSMPLEFLLATHIATMAPDLSYKLATSFNTDVEMLLCKMENTNPGDYAMQGVIRANQYDDDGKLSSDYKEVTYDELQKINNTWFSDKNLDLKAFDVLSLNKKEVMRIFNQCDLQSAVEGEYACTGGGASEDVWTLSVDFPIGTENNLYNCATDSFDRMFEALNAGNKMFEESKICARLFY